MTNIKDFLDSFKVQVTEPNFDKMNKIIEESQEDNEQKEKQNFRRYLFTFIIPTISLIVAICAVVLSSKIPNTKEKPEQQAGIIQELSAKIMSLEARIKDNELSLSKTNKINKK